MAVPVDHGEPGRRGAVDPGISVAGGDLPGTGHAAAEAGGGIPISVRTEARNRFYNAG